MATDSNKLYIVISDSPSASNQEGEEQTASEKKESDRKKSKNDTFNTYVQQQFLNELKSQAMQAVNYSISQYGNLTGDYTAQKNLQRLMSVVNNVVSIGQAAVAGASVGGWIGAAIGASIAITNQVISYGYQTFGEYVSNIKQNREIDILRERSGLNSYLDGSRGTEN